MSPPPVPSLETAASPPRFFYGWVMLGVAIVMAVATMPGQTVLVSLFNPSYREAMNLSVGNLSAAYAVGTFVASLPLAFVGRAADRLGLRIVVGVIAVGFALALVCLSRVAVVSEWLRSAFGAEPGSFIHATLAVAPLCLGFFLIRFMGQGSLSMLAGHTIAMWFERRLGTVHAALAVGGFAAGSALLPQPTAWLIESYGWSRTLLILAGFVLALTMPLVAFVFRNRPEDIGQHLDGDPVEHETHDVMHGGAPPPGDPAFTLRQAVSTRAYWLLMANSIAPGLIGTALIFHMSTMLQSAGHEGSSEQTATAIQAWPIAFGVSTLFFGWIADRVSPRVLLSPGAIVMAGSCIVCLTGIVPDRAPGETILIMAIAMAIFGVSQAAMVACTNPTVARYFGRTHHGAIRGTISTAIVAGTGAGPLLAGIGYDLAGQNFRPILIIFGVACVPLAAFTLALRRPEPPARGEPSPPDPDEPDPPGAAI